MWKLSNRWTQLGLKFIWGSDGNQFKYHTVRWENTCLPKEFGGAGIINTRLLNEALLTKWVWRIYKAEKGNICSELIRKKYLEKHSLATCKTRGGVSILVGHK
jgi:hypothetical protein